MNTSVPLITPSTNTYFILYATADQEQPDRTVLSEITQDVYGAHYSGGNADSMRSSGPQMVSIKEEDLAGILDTPQGQYQMNNWLSGVQEAREADPEVLGKYECQDLWDQLAYRAPGLDVVLADLIRKNVLPTGDFLFLTW